MDHYQPNLVFSVRFKKLRYTAGLRLDQHPQLLSWIPHGHLKRG